MKSQPNHYREEPASSGFWSNWRKFWFSPAEMFGLNAIRILSGLLFLTWALTLVGNQRAFYSLAGWFDREFYHEVSRLQTGTPAPIGWSLFFACGEDQNLIQAVYWGGIAIFALFTLGVATRITGILTWVFVVSFLANPVTSADGDFLMVILAFYLMIAYLLVGQWSVGGSLLERILWPRGTFLLGGKDSEQLSYGSNMVRRLIQVHFAIIMISSLLHKLQMGTWWSGVAYWFPLNPPFETTQAMLEKSRKMAPVLLTVLSLTQYLALAWQAALPFFAWRTGRRFRILLLGGAVIGFIAEVFVFKQPVFGPFTLIGCLSFLTDEEWSWIRDRLPKLQKTADAKEYKSAIAV